VAKLIQTRSKKGYKMISACRRLQRRF